MILKPFEHIKQKKKKKKKKKLNEKNKQTSIDILLHQTSFDDNCDFQEKNTQKHVIYLQLCIGHMTILFSSFSSGKQTWHLMDFMYRWIIIWGIISAINSTNPCYRQTVKI